MRVHWRRCVMVVALATGLAGCGSTGTPSTAPPSGTVPSAAAPGSGAPPAPAGEADRKACTAISDARLKLAAAYLEFSGRAEMYEKDELAGLAEDLLEDVNGAIKDLEKAAADTDDTVLSAAATRFVAGLKEQVVAAEAAGTDVEKVMASTKHAGAQAAEKEIITHCLDI